MRGVCKTSRCWGQKRDAAKEGKNITSPLVLVGPHPPTPARGRPSLQTPTPIRRGVCQCACQAIYLHLSPLLFGAGLITCFFSLNEVVAYTALLVYSIIGTVHVLLSIASLIDLSSPFKTPISNLLWRTLQLIQLTALYTTRSLMSCASPNIFLFRFRLPELIKACCERYQGGTVRAIEQYLESTHSNTDASVRALRWAILSVQTDDELESFIGAIPRFLDSERDNYSQYTIGQLLEDSDVRLGWSIGRLLKTSTSWSCTLDLHVRKGAPSPVPVPHGTSRRSSLVRILYIGTHFLVRIRRNHSKFSGATSTLPSRSSPGVPPLSQSDRFCEN